MRGCHDKLFAVYAIIAGIAIVFFVICYIMYSGGGHSESSPQTEKKGNTKTKTRYDGEPQPLRRVQHRSPATVKHARQLPKEADDEETAPLPQVPKMTLGERRGSIRKKRLCRPKAKPSPQ